MNITPAREAVRRFLGGNNRPHLRPERGFCAAGAWFVAVLGASSYTYAEANGDEQLASWIGARAGLEFYQGVLKLVGSRQHQDRCDEVPVPLRS